MDRNDLNGFEFAVLAVGLLAGIIVAVVWGGAAGAAWVGGAAFDADLGDAWEAAIALPGHLSDPAGAWPAPIGEGLPGPVLYWTATAAVAAVAGGLAAVLVRWLAGAAVGTVARTPLGVDSRARFARRRDLAPLLVRRPRPGRFILGRAAGRLVATEQRSGSTRRRWRHRRRQGDRGAVALVGPSRSGKTAAAISGILEWDGPAVLSSVKTDLLDATDGWRSQLGQVVVYDPTGTTGLLSSSWSPLASSGTVLGAQRSARALCDAAPQGEVKGGHDFWLAQAEILLSGLLYVAHHTGQDMAEVCDWVMTQDRPDDDSAGSVQTLLDTLTVRDDPDIRVGAGEASKALLSVWEMEEETRSSVYATALTVVWPWADPGVAAAARGESIDLAWLLSGNNTVYLSAPIEDQKRLAPAFGGLLNDLIKQAYLRVAATGEPLDPPLLIVVDEAGNAPLRAMPEYASTLAGIGVLLVTIWQSLAQLEAAYGRQADTILTNHLSKVFYAGLSDERSLRYVAQVLGHAEVETASRSDADGRRSWQLGTTPVDLAPAHVVRQMRQGDALLVHGTLPPAHLRTRPYFTDRRLAQRAAFEPNAAHLLRRSSVDAEEVAPP